MPRPGSAARGNRPQANAGMIRLARTATLLAFFGLLALLVAWHAFIAPPESFPRALLLLFLGGPLLFPMRGILQGRPYTHAWTSLMALVYFTLGVFEVAGNSATAPLGWVQIGLSLMLFTGAMWFARLRARQQRRARERAFPEKP